MIDPKKGEGGGLRECLAGLGMPSRQRTKDSGRALGKNWREGVSSKFRGRGNDHHRRSTLTVGGSDPEEQAHRLTTARAERERCWCSGERGGGAELYGPAGMSLDAQAFGPGGGMTEAVVSDGS